MELKSVGTKLNDTYFLIITKDSCTRQEVVYLKFSQMSNHINSSTMRRCSLKWLFNYKKPFKEYLEPIPSYFRIWDESQKRKI